MKKPSNTAAFLTKKREKARLDRLRGRASTRPKARVAYRSQTLDLLFRHLDDNSVSRKSARIEIPETFSIIDDPESALPILAKVASIARWKMPIRELYFDHSKLKSFDLAAELILDHIAMELHRERRLSRPGLTLKGALPTDTHANRFIRAIGIVEKLGVKELILPISEKERLEIFCMFARFDLTSSDKLGDQTLKEIAAAKLVTYVNSCLARIGYALTDTSMQSLGSYTGETLDNAERHSGSSRWMVAGYLDSESESLDCEIAIFNFGTTIAETFENLPEGHYARDVISPFIDKHTQGGIFGESWQKDNLLTLVALQGKISSKNESPSDTGGIGTVDLIRFFESVSAEIADDSCGPAKMTFISGRTRIIFDGKYKMQPDSHGREVIAFNKENSLEKRPDRSSVVRIRCGFFPGTIVSIRFSLPKSQIRNLEIKK